jgi:hypothetical protein
MRLSLLFAAVMAAASAAPPPLFNSASDADWKAWTALRGSAQLDSSTVHEGRQTLRVEPADQRNALVRSAPITLHIGKHYELSAWVRTQDLVVRDTDRSPIAIGAAISMASTPFDMHSASLAGTHDWTRLKLTFTATRSRDHIALTAGNGGTFRGKAWFDHVTLEEVSAPGRPARASVQTFGPAYRYPQAGWIYLHIEGRPYDRGYQHGHLMAPEIERYIDRCAAELDPKSRETAWGNGRTVANALFLRGFDGEILEEMKGIADGAAAAGAKYGGRSLDLVDIVAANTITELGLLSSALHVTPTGLEGLGLVPPAYARPREPALTDRCSAFAATGKATRDGHMVIAHTTWWPLTLAEQTNVMLDVKPLKGHRVLMQSYPGGIQSGTDWYQNDAGVVLTETTIRQSPFNREGAPVAFRAREAIQYGDNIDKVVEHLEAKNNGLYTNEWLIGDAKNDEIAMFELGTNKTRLWRSSKNEWFAGTEGFYWGCNNAKDLAVRLEYVPDPAGRPQHLPFVPAPRDLKWQELYRQHRGSIDEQFGFLAFRTAPLVSGSAMDAKVTTAAMASNLMVWAAFGKPNQREWVPQSWDRERYSANDGLYSSGYTLIAGTLSDSARALVTELEQQRLNQKPAPKPSEPRNPRIERGRLWKGWILPASDEDLWLSAGSATYHGILASDDARQDLERLRIQFRGLAVLSDTPLANLQADTNSSNWYRIASVKGSLLLDALRVEIGDDTFLTFMKDWFAANTTRTVTTASFRSAAEKAAGRSLAPFFDQWLTKPGLPGDRGGPSYVASDIFQHFGTTLIVYGTLRDAGANRYASEQLQKQMLGWHESEVPIFKDFELTEFDLRGHSVIFIGCPESNQALAAIAPRIGLDYDGAAFRINGAEHGSEYESLVFAAANPFNPKQMVVAVAGNTALETVKAADHIPSSQYAIFRSGAQKESGTAH